MTDIFLRMNGFRFAVEAKTAHGFIVGLLEAKEATFDALHDWIKDHIQEL